MRPNSAESATQTPTHRSAIEAWSFAVYLEVISMPRRTSNTETYVPNSDEELDSVRGRSSSGTSNSTSKRRRSPSPAPKQNKRSKPDSSSGKSKPGNRSQTKTKNKKSRSKKTIAELTLEERAAKNAESRLSTMEKRQAKPAKLELAETIERIKESSSKAYSTFEYPKLVKPRVKGAPVRYHAFVCKTCRKIIKRKVGTGETSSLLKHQAQCELRRHQGLLSEYGITGGGGPPSVYDVRQYAAQWLCEDGRPFGILYDRYLRKLFPVEIIKMLPMRSTIVKDISTIYRMTQNTIRTMLAGIVGVFHIALDMYQSPNGQDFLGVVIFHPAVKENQITIERFVLECLSFGGKHTGRALAHTVYGILRKFEIKDRVWGVVCDNASNNQDMMNRFSNFNMKRLTGPEARIHCLPHVLNLASKAAAAPFLQKREEIEQAARDPKPRNREPGSLSDDESQASFGSEDEEAGRYAEARLDEEGLLEDFDPNEEDETGEDDGTAPSRALDYDSEDESELSDIALPDLPAGSVDGRELKAARKALFKIAWFARRLRFSAQFKKSFEEFCEDHDAPTPYNVQRDVITRWNSTKSMIEDAIRLEDAILKFQKKSDFPTEKRLSNKDFKAMKHLLRVLKPLSILTEIMSQAHIPMLADVLVHFDSLNHEYCRMALDESLPLWARQAANRIRLKLDKYYNISDESIMYRLAVLLHPSNRESYLTKVNWLPEWITEAHEIAVQIWEAFYKPESYDNATDDTSSQSQFGYSSFADDLYGSLAEENDRLIDPVTSFIKGKPIIERNKSGKSKPVNPLSWWHAQRLAGEEHDGLTQMALDVLTAPASSVEVERAFSFVSHLVSKRRHSMAAYTVQSTATLGAYSRANLVHAGSLAKAHRRARERAQADARAKAAQAKAKAAAAEAAAVAAEQEDEELVDDVSEDDEDVLQPSSDVEDVDLDADDLDDVEE